MAAFEEFGLLPEIAQAIEEVDWMLPTDVQAEAIPLILGGGDVLMAAETGSGKTGAFCLPIIQIVYETLKDIQEGKGQKSDNHGNAWVLNQQDRTAGLAITPDGLSCQSKHPQQWNGCRAQKGLRADRGKYYYEVRVTEESGVVRVGWSTDEASHDLGTDRCGFGYGATGKKSFGKQFDTYGESFTMGDVIGCVLDKDTDTIKFVKNGNDLGTAFQIPNQLKSNSFYPAFCLKNSGLSVNFGSSPFTYQHASYLPLSKVPQELTVTRTSSEIKDNVKKVRGPLALIIEPSRELAEQTYKVITNFKKHLTNPVIKDVLIVGGVDSRQQMAALSAGVDIVIGTPGRLEDMIDSDILSLCRCKFLVLDEADGLLQQGHSPFIQKLHGRMSSVSGQRSGRLQMVVCSATLHNFDVKKLADSLMHFPTWVDLKGQDSVPETVHHVVVMVDPRRDKLWERLKAPVRTDEVHAKDRVGPNINSKESLSEAVKILKAEYTARAIKEHKMDKCIIFCRTKIDCDNLEEYLLRLGGGAHAKNNPYSCSCLHGDRKPAERQANLENFKKGLVKFLICTDVAARGIDITGLPYTINVTLPDDKSNYLHRIGRVGRVDRMGLAISLVSAVPEKVWFHKCNNRGKNCYNTNLTTEGGCTIWYNEPQYLSDIEEHLGVTIQQIDPDIKVPADEFDGKVVYGGKKKELGSGYEGHMLQLAPKVQALANLEKKAQTHFLRMTHGDYT